MQSQTFEQHVRAAADSLLGSNLQTVVYRQGQPPTTLSYLHERGSCVADSEEPGFFQAARCVRSKMRHAVV